MRLTARVAEAQVELAVAECHALTGSGCLQGDPVGDRVELSMWMPATASPGAAALARHLEGAGIPAEVSEAEQDDSWRHALRDFHQPVVAGRVRVRPPWVAPAPGFHDVVIDPGMAFGTGQHATTRTALALLQRIPARGPVLDAGCGSGVLAIAARRMGMGPVVAIDLDPEAVTATTRAARANMVDGIDVRLLRIGVDPLPGAQVLLANITLEVLGTVAAALRGQSPIHAVLSGLRVGEVDAAVAAFAPLGLSERERMADDGWASVRLSA